MVFAFLLLLSFASCKTQLYVPTEANATADATLVQLKQGRRLYVDNCGSCHALHLPNEYPAEKWKSDIEEMKERAKISDSEAQLIYKYLASAL